jgi:hypothetical protein
MEIKTLVLDNKWVGHMSIGGVANGYIGVPVDHPWFGVDYDSINMDVHGGLTYATDHAPDREADGFWWLGFDTMHPSDTIHNCNVAYVTAEVERMKEQALAVLDKVASQELIECKVWMTREEFKSLKLIAAHGSAEISGVELMARVLTRTVEHVDKPDGTNRKIELQL